MIALYIRLSLDDEKYDSMSIENQQILLREKAASLSEYSGSEIKEFIDNGYSGVNFERPAVQKLLEFVKAGQVSTILVKDFSRLGRNSLETLYFIQKVFPLYHVRFIAVSDNFDSLEHKGDTGGIDVAFKHLINECYSRDMSIKSKTAKLARMKRGEYQSVICPYGYKKGEDGKMTPDEETADNVRKIFEWAANGITAGGITRKLYELGIPTPAEHKAGKGKNYYDISRTNGVWSSSTVLRILDDERYTGMYVIGKSSVVEIGSTHIRRNDESKWIKIPDHHKPIVSRELFEQAKSRIRKFKLPNKQPQDYPLRGKVYCGCCDHAMYISNGRHYKCRHSLEIKDMACHNLSIPIKELEKVVFDTINAQMKCAFSTGDIHSDAKRDTAMQEEHEKKICFLQDSKRELYEQFVLGELDAESYKAQKAELDVKLAYERNVSAVIASQVRSEQNSLEETERKKEIAAELNSADTLTRSLVDLLIKRIYILPDQRIEIEYLSRTFF